MQAAGGSLADVAQVLIYMTDVADMPAIDAVTASSSRRPGPTASSMGVAGLVVPGMKIEIVAYRRDRRAGQRGSTGAQDRQIG